MNFAVPVDHRIKENEKKKKIDKYSDLARGLFIYRSINLSSYVHIECSPMVREIWVQSRVKIEKQKLDKYLDLTKELKNCRK